MIVPLRRQKPPFWRVDYLGKRTLFSIFHMSPANLPSYVDAIHDTEFRYVQGYPSALHLVARAMLEAGRPLAPGRVAGVFTSSESLLSFQRESIEKAFGATVRDHYSATEKAVSMTACAENMLHLDMEFGIVEVEPTEQTEEHIRGSLLVTGLGNPATLFIRYRIGDVGTLSKKPCRCGRPGDVFLDIDGRIEDYVMTPDGALVGRLDHVFKQRYEVAEAQILQQEKSSVEVLVVPARGFNAESSRDLRKAIQARLGPAMNVEIRLVESIPREANGKLRAVRSKIARLQP